MALSWPKGVGYDYYAPFVRAVLIAPDGKTRLPIWTNLDSSGAPNSDFLSVQEKTGIGSIPFLTHASVKITRGWVPHLSVTLTPPYREGLNLLDSVFSEFAETQLELTMGYFSNDPNQTLVSSPTWRGVTRAPQIQLGINTSITIHAIGTGGFRAMNQEVSNIPSAKASRRELINSLLEATKPLNSTASPTPIKTIGSDPASLALLERTFQPSSITIDFEAADKDDATRSRLDAVVPISGGYRTALDLALQLLRDAGCTFRFETRSAGDGSLVDTLIVMPISNLATQIPKATFYAYDFPEGKVGPLQGVYPIIAVTNNTPAAFATGHSFQTNEVSSKESGVTQKVVRGAADTTRSSNDVVIPNNASGLLPDGISGWFGDPSAKGALDRMRADLQAYTGNMGMALSVTTLGAPNLFPEDVVALNGLGNRFSGKDHNYCIVAVEHTIDAGGFMTNFKVINNALPALTGGARGTTALQAGASANTNVASPETGSVVTAKSKPGA